MMKFQTATFRQKHISMRFQVAWMLFTTLTMLFKTAVIVFQAGAMRVETASMHLAGETLIKRLFQST
jgi:hypothetical protein